MAENHSTFIFLGYEISLNNKLAAYMYNNTGSFAEFNIEIKDLNFGQKLNICIEKASSFVFANDNETIFYSKVNNNWTTTIN